MATTIHSTNRAPSSTALRSGYGVRSFSASSAKSPSRGGLFICSSRVPVILTNVDSGAHQISWAALGCPDLAIEDLRTMLHFQQEDGRLPQQINWRLKKGLTDPLKPRLYSKDECNDLTQ